MRAGRLSLLALFITCVLTAGGEPVTVVSALGPAIEEKTLDAVLETRERYARLGLRLRKPDLPTRVILLPTTVDLAPYVGPSPGRSRAFSFAGNDHNSIVLAWSAPGNPMRAVAHEYAHLVDPLASAPPWFREGFAEYLSYLEPDESGALHPILPARHAVRLRDSPWLPLDRLMGAARNSADFHHPAFYAQAWLATLWLAGSGVSPRGLRPEMLEAAVAERGASSVEFALREHFESMDRPPVSESEAAALPEGQALLNWEVRLALADVNRELGRVERARAAFEALEAERPGDPRLEAARGALAMDAGRYGEAEERLERATHGPSVSARTRYRLALMLLRPAGADGRKRARMAAEQARLALERAPESKIYRLALAQALMVDEQWGASARELRLLASSPEWRARASEEMEELSRRRQQVLRDVPKPRIDSLPVPPALPAAPLELAAVPDPPKPPPPAPLRWPPPGSTILVGRIDYVDCSGPEKIIVMRHPLFRQRIRERRGRPAKLFHSPQKDWTEIPCGAKGWTVNVAYYPRAGLKGILGDAAAILF